MTLKKFLNERTGLVCITGWVSRLKSINFTSRPVIRFPENEKHPSEQAAYVKKILKSAVNANAIIITHSAYIVSDFDQEDVLVISKKGSFEKPDFQTFGASINMITMSIFECRCTIGAHAWNTLRNFHKILSDPKTHPEEIILVRASLNRMGDSIEKTLMSASLNKIGDLI